MKHTGWSQPVVLRRWNATSVRTFGTHNEAAWFMALLSPDARARLILLPDRNAVNDYRRVTRRTRGRIPI